MFVVKLLLLNQIHLLSKYQIKISTIFTPLWKSRDPERVFTSFSIFNPDEQHFCLISAICQHFFITAACKSDYIHLFCGIMLSIEWKLPATKLTNENYTIDSDAHDSTLPDGRFIICVNLCRRNPSSPTCASVTIACIKISHRSAEQ